MAKRLQITVANEAGMVIDSGWIALPEEYAQDSAGRPLTSEVLFDTALSYGLDTGIYVTPEEAEGNA